MPVIKSAKKKARQAIRHQERNQGMQTRVKTMMKKILILSKTNVEEAKKMLPEAFSVIDTACKKHLLHRNNADHKKSLLAKTVDKAGKAPASNNPATKA